MLVMKTGKHSVATKLAVCYQGWVGVNERSWSVILYESRQFVGVVSAHNQ